MTLFVVAMSAWLSFSDGYEQVLFPALDEVELLFTPKEQRYLVGQVFVIGNDNTGFGPVLDRLPLSTAIPLCRWRVFLGELRLARSGLFKVDLLDGVWPRVEAQEPYEGVRIRDIIVKVVEKPRAAPPAKE